jgi:branched-chain amino acid transport system permease protein
MGIDWKRTLKYGLTAGVAYWYVCLVGMVETFDSRGIIDNTPLTLGRALLVVIGLGMGYLTGLKLLKQSKGGAVAGSLVTGLLGAALIVALMLVMEPLNMRVMFVNASPKLVKILTFGVGAESNGFLLLGGSLVAVSLLGGLIAILPDLPRRAVMVGLGCVLLFGMLTDLLTVLLGRFTVTDAISDLLYTRDGLSLQGAVIVFVFFAGINGLWASQSKSFSQGVAKLPSAQQRTLSWVLIGLSLVVLLLLPQAVGPYISQILVLVGLYALMGLGLNIEIGLAGLLDLGFVGFFAIGAYTVALMTTAGELAVVNSNFWVAIPIAIVVAGFAGVFLGIPVLRMRGDYLAIVTLGFAEIIRILVLSDFLRPVLGGAQGVLNIPKPPVALAQELMASTPGWLQAVIGAVVSLDGRIKDPGQFYYVIIIGCFVVSFVAWRLQNARIGRSWMALREDEDVAEAMGINLISAKLLAFGIGAAFAGLSGAIFAAQVGSVFPHSFGLIVSINVVSLVIIGGAGSIPGVIVGSLVLVGLPELLREFAEYRLLIYGMLLVVMMLVKPEGLWPSSVTRREMSTAEDTETVPVAQTVVGRV